MDAKAESGRYLTPQLATVAAALIALIGALAGHYVTQFTAVTTATRDVDVKKLEVENSYKLEKAKHEHQVELEAQKFVRDIIAKTLEKGSAEEQTRNLKAYARINLIGSPYKEALLSLSDQELPSVETEKIVGRSSDDLNPFELEKFLKASHAVGKIAGKLGSGTGFLISDRLLMTVHHVLHDKEAAENAVVQFRAEASENGNAGVPAEFSLDPQAFFVSSEIAGYTIVAVKPESKQGETLAKFGKLNLSRGGKILIGDSISLIHHPKGAEKKVNFRGGSILARTTNLLHYGVFSEPGSGGGPVLNNRSEVIAVHSGFVPARDNEGRVLNEKGLPLSKETDFDSLRKIAKEGYLVSSIISNLAFVAPTLPPAQRSVLETMLRE
ncbi:V8-like Glu-specific endopeptidase [Bradyrhizobium sp. USDA 3397]